jgi:hypothetical protein
MMGRGVGRTPTSCDAADSWAAASNQQAGAGGLVWRVCGGGDLNYCGCCTGLTQSSRKATPHTHTSDPQHSSCDITATRCLRHPSHASGPTRLAQSTERTRVYMCELQCRSPCWPDARHGCTSARCVLHMLAATHQLFRCHDNASGMSLDTTGICWLGLKPLQHGRTGWCTTGLARGNKKSHEPRCLTHLQADLHKERRGNAAGLTRSHLSSQNVVQPHAAVSTGNHNVSAPQLRSGRPPRSDRPRTTQARTHQHCSACCRCPALTFTTQC